MCRRFVLIGSGDTLVLLAASTISDAGVVRLPYADMLAPPPTASTNQEADALPEGPWGEWLRIIASLCSCHGGSSDNSCHGGSETATTATTTFTTKVITTSTANGSNGGGCRCCASTAIESLVGAKFAQRGIGGGRGDEPTTTAAAAQQQQQRRNFRVASAGRYAAEELLARAIHNLSDEDWTDWLRVPLIGAAAQGNADAVELLLEAGIAGGGSTGIGTWMIPGGDGRTLLHAAADSGNARVIEALLDAGAGVVVNSVTGCRGGGGGSGGGHLGSGGFSPFHVAAIQGSVPAAMALARAGAAVHRRAPFQQSALHLAAGTGNVEMVYALVTELRLAVEGSDDLGATALHAAAWHGEAGCVRALLDVGAEVDARDECGRSPLFQACRCGGGGGGGTSSRDGCKAVGELLAAGADVNAASDDGETGLYQACRYGNTKAVHLLLRHDADETARCDLGKTPGDVAREAAVRAARRRSSRAGNDGVDAGECGGGGGGGGLDDFSSAVAAEIELALAAAPAGRAWRRRGWLVMLRARLIEFETNMNSRGSGTQEATGWEFSGWEFSEGLPAQDEGGSALLPTAWAATVGLIEEREFFSVFEEPIDFDAELDEALLEGAAPDTETSRPRAPGDYAQGITRLCAGLTHTRPGAPAFLGRSLGQGVCDGVGATTSGDGELRAADFSAATDAIDHSSGYSSSSSDETCSIGGKRRRESWGFHARESFAARRAAPGGSRHESSVCVEAFHELVNSTLEMADGPFEIIVSYL